MTDIESVILGAAELAASDDAVAELRRRQAIDARRARLMKADVPLTRAERLRLVDDVAHDVTRALHATRLWLDEAIRRVDPGPTVLVLSGPEGTGRTYAAAWAIASEGGRYRDVDDLAFAYRRAMAARATLAERHELDVWRKARVLVLARVGAERDVRTVREALGRIFDARETPRSQLTVVLTELHPHELLDHAGAHYDARTNERLRADVRVVNLHARRSA